MHIRLNRQSLLCHYITLCLIKRSSQTHSLYSGLLLHSRVLCFLKIFTCYHHLDFVSICNLKSKNLCLWVAKEIMKIAPRNRLLYFFYLKGVGSGINMHKHWKSYMLSCQEEWQVKMSEAERSLTLVWVDQAYLVFYFFSWGPCRCFWIFWVLKINGFNGLLFKSTMNCVLVGIARPFPVSMSGL